MKDVAVVIVNWNKKELLRTCLDSMRKQTYKDFSIVMVDNGSEDGSPSFVKENYPETEVIELKKNTGFAKGNNIGIFHALEDKNINYVVTLNNDTEAKENYIKSLVSCVKSNPRIGSVQPKVINFFEPQKIDSAGLLISKDMGAIDRGVGKNVGDFQKEEEIFGASASAALYSREALEKTKLAEGIFFDNDYFAYYEDVDLAWRLRLAGFSSYFCPSAQVLHIHGASAKKFSTFQKFHIHRNHYFNILKNLPTGFLFRTLFLMLTRYFILAKGLIIKKGSGTELVRSEGGGSIVKIIPKVWWQVIISLPKLLRKRKIIQKSKTVKNEEIKDWFKRFGIGISKSVYGN